MKESRSASQILFGFLPGQTVDLQGGVWKVTEWRHPKIRNDVDIETLRSEIIRQIMPWRNAGTDGNYFSHLSAGAKLTVVTLDENNGVDVTPFPKYWNCRACGRIHDSPSGNCECGKSGERAQLYFVGFHQQCGSLRAPVISRCPEHKQVKIVYPGTSAATEIVFKCPVCEKKIKEGFGWIRCECGEGYLSYQPHRAASVYTPRTVVIVNPPSREREKILSQAGGPPKALDWVVNGMEERTVESRSSGSEAIRRQLLDQGLDEETINRMLEAAGGEYKEDEPEFDISTDQRAEAEAEAVKIAHATISSRLRIYDLSSQTPEDSALGALYRNSYADAIESAGLYSVDLIDKFPVLTGHFGYTRGDFEPGAGRLVPFKNKDQGYRVYADIAETEALFVRLDPKKVASWLINQGFELPSWSNDKEARLAILSVTNMPQGSPESGHSVSALLLKLVHSYSHRFIRIAATYTGIETNSLAELLTPLHLGFFVYAASAGDFVLGGLQAVFETELHNLLSSVVFDEHRCALDPGCANAGAACMACLHVGEPSCRYFNRYLGRNVLFGNGGFLNFS